MSKIVILGCGGWGIALSVTLSQSGNETVLWSPFKQEVDMLNTEREYKKLLPGVRLSDSTKITDDINAVKTADAVVIATPSFAVRETAARLKNLLLPETVVVCVAKGIDEERLERLSVAVEEEIDGIGICALSGPSHAEEVARGVPTVLVASSKSRIVAEKVQDIFMNPRLRIYTTPDIVGVELGGAFKNVIALAAGICDGMQLGDNTKAALMTRGITEIARLGVAMGASPETFAGLTGFGDLIVTCCSMHSRNRRAGIFIGQGMTAKQAIEAVGMTVEGYKTASSAYRLANKYHIEMPIVNEIYKVLYEDKDPHDAINDLMLRQKKHESEEVWLNHKEW